MQIINSHIINIINKCLFFIQSKTENIKNSSFLLSNIDFFTLISFLCVYISSSFAQNKIIAFFASLAVFFALVKLLISKGAQIELKSCGLYLTAYLFICLFSCLVSSMPVLSFYGFSKTLLYAAFYFAASIFLKYNKKSALILFAVITAAMGIESIIGIIQNNSGILSLASWQDMSSLNPEDAISRAYGTLKPYNPNLFAGWLICCIPFAAGLSFLCFKKQHITGGILSALLFVLSALCIFCTGSRGAYAALFAVLLCFFAALIKQNKYYKMAAGAAAAACAAFVMLNSSILKRLMSIFMFRADSSSSFRMNVYHSAFEMFKDNPIWGIGAGNKVFREIYGLYMMSGFDALSCYCVFLEIAVESGIFALIAFIMFLGSILNAAFKKIAASDDIIERTLLFSAAVSIIGAMIHGLADTVFFRPQLQFVFWTSAAAITAYTGDADKK